MRSHGKVNIPHSRILKITLAAQPTSKNWHRRKLIVYDVLKPADHSEIIRTVKGDHGRDPRCTGYRKAAAHVIARASIAHTVRFVVLTHQAF
jgi:hypothetical protein